MLSLSSSVTAESFRDARPCVRQFCGRPLHPAAWPTGVGGGWCPSSGTTREQRCCWTRPLVGFRSVFSVRATRDSTRRAGAPRQSTAFPEDDGARPPCRRRDVNHIPLYRIDACWIPQILHLDFYKPPTKQHLSSMSSEFSTSGGPTSIPHSRINRVSARF